MPPAAPLLLWLSLAAAALQGRGAGGDAPVEAIPTQIVAGPKEARSAVVLLRWLRDVADDSRVDIEPIGGTARAVTGAHAAGSRLLVSVPIAEKPFALNATIRIAANGDHWVSTIGSGPLDGEWVMHLIPGFHYDPVWWNTQANYTETGLLLDSHQAAGHTLVSEYLRKLAEDPTSTAALHQLPYLKTFLEAHPEREAELKATIASGRLDLVGGTYNELSSTLVSAEAAARNAIYGALFQRNVLGGRGSPFGRPTSSATIRRSQRSWRRAGTSTAPSRAARSISGVRRRERPTFRARFLWMAPDGTSVLTHYMTGHYGVAYEKLASGGRAPRGRGANQSRPRRALPGSPAERADAPRDGADAYGLRPPARESRRGGEGLERFLPIAAPRDQHSGPLLRRRARGDRGAGIVPPVITRDMNPIFTGCQVSFADLKTANRLCESALREAEIWATVAALEGRDIHRWD